MMEKNEITSFEDMYTNNRDRLVWYAERSAHEDAEGVAQEVLIKAWQHNIDNERAAPWLMAVCKNHLIDQYRARQARPNAIALDTDEIDERRSADSHHILLKGLVCTAMEELSSHHRQALELVYLREMTVKEAAEVANVPYGTMQTRAFYARAAAKAILIEQGITPDDVYN